MDKAQIDKLHCVQDINDYWFALDDLKPKFQKILEYQNKIALIDVQKYDNSFFKIEFSNQLYKIRNYVSEQISNLQKQLYQI